MHIWAVANQKGGVGKTTTAVALGGIASEQGLRVLLIDLDPHGSMSSYFGFDPDQQNKSSFTLFEHKNADVNVVRGLIVETGFERLSLLPAATVLATLERRAIGQDGMGLVLQRALALLEADFDLVLVDSPPLLGVLMINALAACSELIVPVQTEHLALKGLERMVHTLDMMLKSRRKALDYTIVGTMFDRRTQASNSSLRLIRNTYPEKAWPGKIPVDTKFRDASKQGVPPHLFAPDSRGVDAYRSLFKFLRQRTEG